MSVKERKGGIQPMLTVPLPTCRLMILNVTSGDLLDDILMGWG